MIFYPTSFYYLQKSTPTESGWTEVNGYVSKSGSTSYYLYNSTDFGKFIIVTGTWNPYRITIDGAEAAFRGFYNGHPRWVTVALGTKYALFYAAGIGYVIAMVSSDDAVVKIFSYTGSFTDFVGRTVNYSAGTQYWFSSTFNFGNVGSFNFSQNGGGTSKTVVCALHNVSQSNTLLGAYSSSSGGVTPNLRTMKTERVYQGNVGALI